MISPWGIITKKSLALTTDYVLGIVLRALWLSHLILSIALWNRSCYYPHFTTWGLTIFSACRSRGLHPWPHSRELPCVYGKSNGQSPPSLRKWEGGETQSMDEGVNEWEAAHFNEGSRLNFAILEFCVFVFATLAFVTAFPPSSSCPETAKERQTQGWFSL